MPNCLQHRRASAAGRLIVHQIVRRRLVALERERVLSRRAPCRRWSSAAPRPASSSSAMPAPSSLGPAMGASERVGTGASAEARSGGDVVTRIAMSPFTNLTDTDDPASPHFTRSSFGFVRTPARPSPAAAVQLHDVGGEVEAAVERCSRRRRRRRPARRPSSNARMRASVEAARHDDLHVAEALGVERVAHVPHELRRSRRSA